MNVWYILNIIKAFIIVLGINVLIHEFGHYLAARLTGVRVETFSFGFGKRLFGKKVGETDFRFSLIPLGGYVKMSGEEDYDPQDMKPYEFNAKNRAQKIFILIMGPVMNVVLAFLIFTTINITGVEVEAYKSLPPQIGYVEKGSPAEKAGIQKGDFIRTIDGRSIKDWKELEITIGSNPSQKLPVEFERNGELKSTILDISSISKYHVGDAGIYWDFKTNVESVTPDSPAFYKGIKAGDILLAIDKKPTGYFEIVEAISQHAGEPLVFTVKRGETQFDVTIVPKKVYFLKTNPVDTPKEATQKLEQIRKAFPGFTFGIEPKEGKYRIISDTMDTPPTADKYKNAPEFTVGDKGIIGVGMGAYSPTTKTNYGLWAAVKKSVTDMGNLIELVFNSIRKIIVGKLSPKSLSGPIEIAKFSQKAMESGASNFFMLIAFISLQLGLINLFPIPALDGGQLLTFSIEAIIRRDFSPKVKNIVMNIGFFILIALMVFVILNDISKIVPLPFFK